MTVLTHRSNVGVAAWAEFLGMKVAIEAEPGSIRKTPWVSQPRCPPCVPGIGTPMDLASHT